MTTENEGSTNNGKKRRSAHMPSNSPFFEKIVPALLLGMAVLMGALILFAAGVLLGVISF